MLQSVLDHIKTNILTLNPKTFQKGYAGARQYQDGKIVIYDNGEGTYVGLKDNEFNYFYIRYLEDFQIDAADTQRSTSCFELTGTPNLRLVAWVRNGDFNKLVTVLINDIQSTDFTTMTQAQQDEFSDLQIFFTAIQPDFEQIYKDETGNDNASDVKGVKNLALVAIDFGILFNYKAKSNDCIDRDICVGCTV